MTETIRKYKLHKSSFDTTTIILIVIAAMVLGYIFFYKKPEHFSPNPISSSNSNFNKITNNDNNSTLDNKNDNNKSVTNFTLNNSNSVDKKIESKSNDVVDNKISVHTLGSCDKKCCSINHWNGTNNINNGSSITCCNGVTDCGCVCINKPTEEILKSHGNSPFVNNGGILGTDNVKPFFNVQTNIPIDIKPVEKFDKDISNKSLKLSKSRSNKNILNIINDLNDNKINESFLNNPEPYDNKYIYFELN